MQIPSTHAAPSRRRVRPISASGFTNMASGGRLSSETDRSLAALTMQFARPVNDQAAQAGYIPSAKHFGFIQPFGLCGGVMVKSEAVTFVKKGAIWRRQ